MAANQEEGILDPWVSGVARDPSGTAQGQRGLLYCTNGAPAGLIGYIHGGAFTVGSIGIMDNLAGELSKI
jgi:hypothetical protein